MSRNIGFRASEETKKKVDEIAEHLQKFSLSKISASDVLRHAIDKLHEEYKKNN